MAPPQNPIHEIKRFTIVEAVGEFVEVEGKVLLGNAMINAHDTALGDLLGRPDLPQLLFNKLP